MKCAIRKITILEFQNREDFKRLLKPDCLYFFEDKYRLIYKRHTPYKTLKNTYIEYFKTLEYGEIIQEP